MPSKPMFGAKASPPVKKAGVPRVVAKQPTVANAKVGILKRKRKDK